MLGLGVAAGQAVRLGLGPGVEGFWKGCIFIRCTFLYIHIYIYTSLYIYIYIFMYIYMCMCICLRGEVSGLEALVALKTLRNRRSGIADRLCQRPAGRWPSLDRNSSRALIILQFGWGWGHECLGAVNEAAFQDCSFCGYPISPPCTSRSVGRPSLFFAEAPKQKVLRSPCRGRATDCHTACTSESAGQGTAKAATFISAPGHPAHAVER